MTFLWEAFFPFEFSPDDLEQDGEIWIGMSIEATFNYTGSKG